MTITIRDTQAAGADNSTSTVIPAPTVSDGDMMIMIITIDDSGGSNTGTPPAGWTAIAGMDGASGGNQGNAWWRIADSENGTYTITHNQERTWASLTVLAGISLQVNETDDGVTRSAGTSASPPLPSVTPTKDGSAVIAHVGSSRGNGGSAIATAWPSSLVEQEDNTGGPGGTGTSSQSGALAVEIQTTASNVSGNVTLSVTAAQYITFCIIVEEGVAVPTISNAGDEDFRDGETGIVITGTTFETPKGTGKVEISDNATYATGTKITQTTTAWDDTSITFTASLSTLAPGTLYLWVTNDSGDRNSVGYSVSVHRKVMMKLSLSGNVTGEDAITSARLTGGTGSFTNGLISENTNPLTTIDIGTDGHTEVAWVITNTADAAPTETYEFRVLDSDGTELDTYPGTDARLSIVAGVGGSILPLLNQYYH